MGRRRRSRRAVAAGLLLAAVGFVPAQTPQWRLGPRFPASTGAMASDDDGAIFFVNSGVTHWYRSDRWWPGPSLPVGFTGRPEQGLAWDAQRGVFVCVGGAGSNLDETWEVAEGDWRVNQTPGPPSRGGFAMAYDRSMQEVVLHGGSMGQVIFGDSWLYDGTDWGQETGTTPSPRVLHAMAWDAARDQMVLFGGYGLTDTWLREGGVWRMVTTAVSPPSRHSHSMAFDPGLAEVLLAGGTAGDTWSFDGSDWRQRAANGPLPFSFAMSHTDDSILAWTGVHISSTGGPTYTFDGWRWDGQWSKVQERPLMPGAQAATVGGRTVIYGGQRPAGLVIDLPDEVWFLVGDSWVEGPSSPVAMKGRRDHRLVLDSRRDRLVTYGGRHGWDDLDDTWEYDGNTWVPGPSGSPTVGKRSAYGLAFDSRRGVSVLVGGTQTLQWPSADVWEYDGGQWTPGVLPPAAFAPRSNPAMAYDEREAAVLVFGGQSSMGVLGDGWLYDGTDWIPLAGSLPPPRRDAVLVYAPQQSASLMIGGADSMGAALPEVWRYDAAGWSVEALPWPVGPRDVSVTWDPGRRAVVVVDAGSVFQTLEWGEVPGSVVAGPGAGAPNPNRLSVFDLVGRAAVCIDVYSTGAFGTRVAVGRPGGSSAILTAPGPGVVFGPHVRGYAGTGVPRPGLSFYAYGTLRYGANIDLSDTDADTADEIVTGAGPGTVFGPHLRGFRYVPPSVSAVSGVNLYAFSTLKFGVNPGGGSLDSDAPGELLAAPGPGVIFGPHVRGFDVDGGNARPMGRISFSAFGTSSFGALAKGGDVTNDGFSEIVVGQGPGPAMTARVRAFAVAGSAPVPLSGFDAVLRSTVYGLLPSLGELGPSPGFELLIGAGPDPVATSRLTGHRWDGSVLLPIPPDFEAYPGLAFGVVPGIGHLGP